MKRLLSLVLCLMLVLSVCSVSAADGAETYTGNMVKLSDEKIELTMFVKFDSSRYKVESYSDLPCMKKMEEITNVHINFIHPTAGSEKEQLNLMLSSGDLPDIISYNWSNSSTTPDQMYENGMILDLSQYIDQYAPNYKARMEENPQIRKDITTDSGIIPCFNQMQFSDALKHTHTYLIRADWLNKVGLDVPVTMDDWYEMLCAFRDNDMNGNGDTTDEIPLTTCLFLNNSETDALEEFYSAWGKYWKMYVTPEKHIAYGAYDQDYKEYLLTMRKWIVEGLIDPDFATNDKTQQDAKFLNSVAGSLRSGLGSGLGTFITGLGDENAIAAAKSPVMNEGDTSYNFFGYSAGVTSSGAVVTTSCKYPELAVMWLDMFQGGDGMLLANYGIEGESYNMVDGYPTLVDYIMRNPDGKSVNVALAEFSLGCSAFPFWNDSAVREQRMMSYPSQREAGLLMADMSLDGVVPNISLTADETMEYSGIISECETYVKEMTVSFLLGNTDIETGFDSYMATLKSMGIEDAIAIYEAALQRYYVR